MIGGQSITRRVMLGQLACLAAWAQNDDDPLRTLRPEHPRIILLPSDADRIRGLARDNPLCHRVYADLEKESEKLLSAPPLDYKAAAPRPLQQANHILDRLTTLAVMYRITGRDPYMRRAIAELRAAASLRDWDPARFTTTATFAHGFALCYDWFYNDVSADDRAMMRAAVISKAFDPAIPVYQRDSGWPREHFNANIICNSALGMAALAMAADPASDVEKAVNEKCSSILKLVLESITRGLPSYGVEGSWPEGPEYWNSVTKYASAFFNALQTALANDFGLSSFHGVDRAGRFRIYMNGPTGKVFNFGDCSEDAGVAPQMFWLAKRFSTPEYAWSEQKAIERTGRPDPYDLVWFDRDVRVPQRPAWPPWAIFRGLDVAAIRSAWEDPAAIFVAVKGGDNKAPHAHLDLGTFVMDAGGVRWASDLGADDYELPGYLTPRQRWTYYRTRTEAHNTLVIDEENQEPRAEARITRAEFAPEFSWVQLDLTRAYPGRIRQWIRRVALAQRQAVLVEDSVRSDAPVDVIWGMITDAHITVSGQTAALKKNSWNLTAEIRSPRHAVFDVTPVRSPAQQAPNTDYSKLVVRLGDKITDLDLNIVLTPWRDGQTKPVVTAQFPAA